MPDIQAHIVNLGSAGSGGTSPFTQLTTDVTSQTNGGVTTINNHVVSNTKLAQVPALSLVGNITTGVADAAYPTLTQVVDNMPTPSTAHQGAVPIIPNLGKLDVFRTDGWGFVLPAFKTTFAYSVGAPALVAGVLYQCITAHTSGSSIDLSKFVAILGAATSSGTQSLEFDKIPLTIGGITLYAKSSAGVTATSPNPGEFVINIPSQAVSGGGVTSDRLQSLDINIPSANNATTTIKVTVVYPSTSVRLWNKNIASLELPEVSLFNSDSFPTRVYKIRFAGSGTDGILDVLSVASGTASYLITLPTPLTTGGVILKLLFA